MSSRVVTVQPVVTLVPYVKGQVWKIHAVGSQPVKKGDLLLEINTEPYQFALNQVECNQIGNGERQAIRGGFASGTSRRKEVQSECGPGEGGH